MNEKMMELGQILSELRESKNLSIEEMAKKNFVDKSILINIENGKKINRNNTYIRLIIKKYYTILGGDFSDLCSLVDESYPIDIGATIDLTKELNYAEGLQKRNSIKKNKSKLGKKIKTILLVIVVIIFVCSLIFLTFINIGIQVNKQKKLNQPTILKVTELVPAKIIEAKPKIKVGTTLNKFSGLEIINLTTNMNESFEFKVVATDGIYIDSSVEGVITEQENLTKGEEKTFKIKPKSNVIINIENINASHIFINDEEVTKEKYKNTHQYIAFDQEEVVNEKI